MERVPLVVMRNHRTLGRQEEPSNSPLFKQYRRRGIFVATVSTNIPSPARGDIFVANAGHHNLSPVGAASNLLASKQMSNAQAIS